MLFDRAPFSGSFVTAQRFFKLFQVDGAAVEQVTKGLELG